MNKVKSLTDTTFDKILTINGKKMSGAKAIVFTYDVDNTIATATMTMHIKRGSVVITDNEISFETPSFKTEVADGH